MRESDRDYFARRALEEREAAERASSEPARISYAQLAERYSEVAKALEAAADGGGRGVNRAIVSRVSIDAQRKAAANTPSTAGAAGSEVAPDET